MQSHLTVAMTGAMEFHQEDEFHLVYLDRRLVELESTP